MASMTRAEVSGLELPSSTNRFGRDRNHGKRRSVYRSVLREKHGSLRNHLMAVYGYLLLRNPKMCWPMHNTFQCAYMSRPLSHPARAHTVSDIQWVEGVGLDSHAYI